MSGAWCSPLELPVDRCPGYGRRASPLAPQSPQRRTAAVSGMCHLWNKMPRASFHSCRSRTIESNLGALVRRQTPFSHSTIRTPTIRNIIDDIQQAERRASELKINQTQNGELFRPRFGGQFFAPIVQKMSL
ncbi:hypothetical protein T03_4964 [Trichinella britovi]|uniref:Uncharacterized protein n=1 Tax=Trichinella britovi TaxID=45882 RepID=A0A0V1CWX0_TRIBR|nr:hypothetical protein T03_4964 [Trichinella britovi]